MRTKKGIEIPDIIIDEVEPIPGRIAWYIENIFVRFGKRLFNAVIEPMVGIVSVGLNEFLELIERPLINMSRPVLIKVRNTEGCPDEVKQTIDEALSGGEAVQALALLPILMIALVPMVTASIAPVLRTLEHTTDTVVRSNRADPVALWTMKRRGVIDADRFQRHMRQTGWSDALINSWEGVTQLFLPGDDMGYAYLRGLISLGEFQDEMRKRGMSNANVEIATELLQIIPGPQDLIRMGVREAWNDEAAGKFGYDQDFPGELAEWGEKIGLSSEWTKRFWRAHWELPGVRDGFEMLHRKIIDTNELELLLRVKDIPRFWRDRLIRLSYRPLNRVDVRRMYKDGVLDEAAVYKSYQDLGYNEDNASSLTEWTIKAYNADGRELAKGDVLSAYRDGTITEADARDYLDQLEYGQDEADVLIARIDIKKEEEFEKEVITNVRVGFVAGVMEEHDVIAQLNSLNPPAGFVEERLKIWRLQKARSIKRLTTTQLRDMWLLETITETELRSELGKLGYITLYQDWLMDMWTKKASD
jgi:hypothetical protein